MTSIIELLLLNSPNRKQVRASNRLSVCVRALCSFLSAWLAFGLLDHDAAWVRKRALSRTAATTETRHLHAPDLPQPNVPSNPPIYAGKTTNFTSFAFCRAVDVIVVSIWTRTRTRSWHPEQRTPQLATSLRKIIDPSVFAISAAMVMWSWFYAPERLPRAYNLWISKAADIDPRLIRALRLARHGDFVYGEDTGQSSLLAGLCHEIGLLEEYGSPAKRISVPCELYHCGTGKSCEFHRLSRLVRSWKFAMKMYAPLPSPDAGWIAHVKSSVGWSSSCSTIFIVLGDICCFPLLCGMLSSNSNWTEHCVAPDNNAANVGLWALCAGWLPGRWLGYIPRKAKQPLGDRLFRGTKSAGYGPSSCL